MKESIPHSFSDSDITKNLVMRNYCGDISRVELLLSFSEENSITLDKCDVIELAKYFGLVVIEQDSLL